MTVLDRLLDKVLEAHPLPWRKDYDWSVEVYDANGGIITTFPSDALATELISLADARCDARRRGQIEVEALLREHGVDP